MSFPGAGQAGRAPGDFRGGRSPLRVDFRIGRKGDRTGSGFTSGWAALGHMDFEAREAPEPPRALDDRLMGLAGYLIANGPVIRDGDTLGEDANAPIRIDDSKSSFGNADRIMRLEYETAAPKKPWWKLW